MLGERPREPENQPSKRGLNYYRTSNAAEFGLFGVVLLSITLGIVSLFDVDSTVLIWIAGVGIAVLALVLIWFCGVLPPFAIRYRRYELGEDVLYVQRGFLTRRRAIVPYARIQTVTTARGPIERRFRLATVFLQTSAGGESIRLIDEEVAEELQDRIVVRTREMLDDI